VSDTPPERAVIPNIDARSGEHLPDLERYRFCFPMAADCVVLDLACGTGYGSLMLATQGRARVVIAADRSREALAQTRILTEDSRVRPIRVNANALPLASGSIDLVVSMETFEHVEAPEIYLKELRRVLRDGGTAVISTPRNEGEGRLRPANPYHVREYSATEFESLLRTSFAHVTLHSQRPEYRDDLFVPALERSRAVSAARRVARVILPPLARRALRRVLASRGVHAWRAEVTAGLADGADVQIAVCS
jgi:SAM-dependent methyltransferase